MNQEMKKQLEAVINATVNEDTQAAKDAFHAYITAKTQQILLGEAEECDKDMDDEDESDEDESDEDESDKDDKKPAFLKKSKKDKKEDKEEDE